MNPVIRTVADFLAQSGYQFDLFDKISSERIEMLDVTYKLGFPYKEKTLGLFQETKDALHLCSTLCPRAPHLRRSLLSFNIRASDFSEMESQEAFMLNLMKRGTEEEELIASARLTLVLQKRRLESGLL